MGGWGELYPSFFGFLEFFNFAKPLILPQIAPFSGANISICAEFSIGSRQVGIYG